MAIAAYLVLPSLADDPCRGALVEAFANGACR